MGTIRIIRGDITKIKVAAIVNAANTTLLGGGGVDGAIHRAAGPELLAACQKLHGCATGEAKITPGFRLPAQFIIHTPGPIWRDGTQSEACLLHNSYRNSLALAAAYNCQTIAFPSLSTGVYRYPLAAAAVIALTTIRDFLAANTVIQTVTMVCFDATTLAAYQQAYQQVVGN
ncbi:O-acetyl-ADP-ribose deacetylase [Loigolactobacillus zhaoyuanensis]|uniref:O-acetyl-ADP-ribose deacetylase n=1 Tax=Loigolactobacillus zhaoyuanensis TaxID=2486017 RepID=A0ABW8UDS8_9LACO|nr:O-acetyl-ADP-ribose deacetylase [Loigolactobacillus zhaoyuanensis]